MLLLIIGGEKTTMASRDGGRTLGEAERCVTEGKTGRSEVLTVEASEAKQGGTRNSMEFLSAVFVVFFPSICHLRLFLLLADKERMVHLKGLEGPHIDDGQRLLEYFMDFGKNVPWPFGHVDAPCLNCKKGVTVVFEESFNVLQKYVNLVPLGDVLVKDVWSTNTGGKEVRPIGVCKDGGNIVSFFGQKYKLAHDSWRKINCKHNVSRSY